MSGTTESPAKGSIDWFRQQVFTRQGTEHLAAHLEGHYGIGVAALNEMDCGVYRVDRRDGPDWVARVFPSARTLEAVEGDASVLRFLEETDFPAERCAAVDPVSTLEGQGVLV